MSDALCLLTFSLSSPPSPSHHPEDWIAQQRAAGQAPISPLTGTALQDLSLRPNLIVRGLGASLRAAGLLQ